jgi:hypothetical protein
MKAVAHFQLGRDRKEAKVYGEELGRYRVASRLIDSTFRFKPVLPEFMHIVEDIMTVYPILQLSFIIKESYLFILITLFSTESRFCL